MFCKKKDEPKTIDNKAKKANDLFSSFSTL